jgi:hypothetical protein
MTAVPAALRAASRPARIGAVLAFALLIAVPTAFTLARDGSFRSTVEMRPVPRKGDLASVPPVGVTLAEYLRRALAGEGLRTGVVAELGFLTGAGQLRDALAIVAPAQRGPGVTAVAESPARARELARVAGLQIVAASSREVGAAVARRLAAVRGALAGAPAAVDRRTLRRRAAVLARLVAAPPARVFPAAAATKPPVTGLDRDLQRLLGGVPPRPEPAVVAISGAIAGLFAAVAILGLSARRARTRPPA